jgi:hypothetical protein
MPAWRGIEFEEDLKRAAKATRREAAGGGAVPGAAAGRSAGARANGTAAHPAWRPAQGKRYYDYDRYWEDVGGPLVARLTGADGPWTEVFDPARVRGGAATAPVEVALVALVGEALAAAPAGR